MPSPFPGMDPWIEDPEIWSDFHGDLAAEIRARLNEVIAPRYVARLTPRRPDVGVRHYAIEVRETGTMELVSAIEILSPVNKNRGHEAHLGYGRKRREILRSEIHLLEIDLLREGERPPLGEPVPPAPYYAVLSRADRRPTAEVWPVSLQDPLPVLPVPLLEPDPDAALDLGAVARAVYERGAYARLIDYRRPPPPPPLTADQTAWIDRRLKEMGLR